MPHDVVVTLGEITPVVPYAYQPYSEPDEIISNTVSWVGTMISNSGIKLGYIEGRCRKHFVEDKTTVLCLQADTGLLIDRRVTNDKGEYRFDNLIAGTHYQIVPVAPDDFSVRSGTVIKLPTAY